MRCRCRDEAGPPLLACAVVFAQLAVVAMALVDMMLEKQQQSRGSGQLGAGLQRLATLLGARTRC